MNLFFIAWRSIQQRGLASFLTMLSMALGVMMVVAVLSIHGVVSQSFRTNSSLGYNLIAGPKGGKLQLTLNTVFYLSQPGEPVPYEFFSEFLPRDMRDSAFKNSIRTHTNDAVWDQLQTLSLLSGGGMPGPESIAGVWGGEALRNAQRRQLDLGRDGKYSQFTALAIPVCLGDYFGQFRVVGTVPEMFTELQFGPSADRHYEFAQGRNFEHWTSDHGFFEAVVGSAVAREMNVKLGDGISPAHGDPEGHGHDQKFTVVGILKGSGTPNDRAVFVNIEGFYLMEDHAKPLSEDEASSAEAHVASQPLYQKQVEPLPIEQREVSAILIRTANPFVVLSLPRIINEGPVAQCLTPIGEITQLFETFVKPIQMLLLVLTGLICIVSGISILVSIYNSMSDRRHEIAVMRALGASRGTVMSIILVESILLSLGGGALGWFGGHALNAAASPYIEARTGVSMSFFDLAPPVESLELGALGEIINKLSLELAIIPALLLLAMIVGLLPALEAYRTDVAKSLGT